MSHAATATRAGLTRCGSCEKLLRSGNKKIRLIAEACMHKVLGVEPQTERLGYELAQCRKPIGRPWYNNSDFTTITLEFEWRSYVFTHTHYDECSNDHFLRRS